ncbi:TonB-dependent receptor [Microbulbifer litoralis]|uniref:TonB-dependent receptor n=1 Tax=Microbulbifer litoralis TaxID=2933965 RepID=UPI0020291AF1|nr:TonB-dependent receptor [Microbulbifer sp. GX H0434]
MFQRKKLSDVIITAVATMACAQQVGAQETSGSLEEITVTGIRASMERAMDIKRDSSGVVDAISAEDIGKFPDTNLAESLQRITGVSIDRVNGEGSQVTIRGFGSDMNMVTLNGRTMPGGSAFGGGSGAGITRGGQSRAFDFANLASESVRGIEVYKTGKANIASGGLGGTINIKTTRPLEDPGFKLSLGAKAVNDTTNLNGDDYTPEVSGIFSWTDDSERWGVSLTSSIQQRDSGAAGATVNDWAIGRWGQDDLYSLTDDAQITNAPEDGQLYVRPFDLRYTWSDRERERTNAQATFQFRPADNITGTLDYTFAENQLTEFRSEQTLWMSNSSSVAEIIFDDSTVATPEFVRETNLTDKDMGFEQQWREQEDTLKSVGFNLDWEVNDSLTLALDAHDSSMESLPAGPGDAGSIDISLGAPVVAGQSWDFRGDLPGANFIFDDSGKANGGNTAGQFDGGDFGSQVARVWYASQKTDISQVKVDGSYEFDNGRFDFGIEDRSTEFLSRQSNRQWTMGDWGINDTGATGLDGLLEPFGLTGQFDDFSPSGDATNLGFRASDPTGLCNWAVENYPRGGDAACAHTDNWSANNKVEEDVQAVYFQVAVDSELGGFPVNYLTGIRYESTDSTSTSEVLMPDYLLWQDNNDFSRVDTDQKVSLTVDNSYDHLLPSFDFSIDLRDDLKGRFSYSKTIARAGLGSLAAVPSGWATNGSTLNGANPTADETNPQLIPFESDNLDLSVEWYYGDTSYVSLGFYEKRVDNFIGNEKENRTFFDMRDVTAGPRAQDAIAALESAGVAVDDTTLFSAMVYEEYRGDPDVVFPSECGDLSSSLSGLANPDCSAKIGSLEKVKRDENGDIITDDNGNPVPNGAVDLSPNSDDPVMVYETTYPTNQKSAKIHGFEFAVQHFFGETGFGVQANYTTVRGDVGYDVDADPSEIQFALPGLSDTANLVGIYDNYGIQARLAYNWRDDYLMSITQGSTDARFVEAHSQWDLNVSYQVNDSLDVFFEGINLTEEDVRHYSRNTSQLWYLEELGARYQVGARYTF